MLAATYGEEFATRAAASALPSEPSVAVGGPLQDALARYWQQQMALWTGVMASAAGQAREAVASPDRGDRRFNANEWRDNPFYSLLKQSYLLNARLLDDMVEASDMDAKAKHKLRFYARQFVDSMSPANFPMMNPDVIKLALESKGDSVTAGVANMLDDLKHKRISITDAECVRYLAPARTGDGVLSQARRR